MNDFFKKNKVYVLTTLKLFNFITNISIQKVDAEKTLTHLLQEAMEGYTESIWQDDKVFEQVYIPRTLQELSVVDILREQQTGI